MSIDPSRLRAIDRLRLLEELGLNAEWLATVKEYARMAQDGALMRETHEMREEARQKWLAVTDLLGFIESRKAGYRREHELEMAEQKSREQVAA